MRTGQVHASSIALRRYEKTEQLGLRCNAKLFPDAGTVKFNGLDTDAQFVGDLTGLLALENTVQNFPFALGKRCLLYTSRCV